MSSRIFRLSAKEDGMPLRFITSFSCPRESSLGTRTVVAHDEEDQRVVGVRQFPNGVEQATALVIRKGEIACEVFHKCRKQLSFIAGQRVPRLDPLWTRRQNRIGRVLILHVLSCC
jgi:hypothetical protein